VRMDGKILIDTYEYSIVNRENTAWRLENEYRQRVGDIFDNPAFPYDAHIDYGELLFVSSQEKIEYGAPDYALITNDLTLDAFYDVNKLGAQAGEITLYVYDETVSVERLAQILLDIRRIFDESGVAFYNIDCVLEYPKWEDVTPKDGRVEVLDFLYSDIYEEGLTERVKASDNAANDYYAEQDAEKLKEMEVK
ncbi:MAG: hypothetical protein IJV87_11025, partial [Clostridia bacterium]|nr:hypothetical protein [Clostridia bacterium]